MVTKEGLSNYKLYTTYQPLLIAIFIVMLVIINFFYEWSSILMYIFVPSVFSLISQVMLHNLFQYCWKHKLLLIYDTIHIPIFIIKDLFIFTEGNVYWLLFEMTLLILFILICKERNKDQSKE